MITTVSLHGLEFYAFHGLYEQESKCGNNFIIDVDISYENSTKTDNYNIANTVDYVVVYDIISVAMKQREELLETVAQKIVDELYKTYSYITLVDFRIKKMNPPFGGKCAYSQIRIKK